MLAKYIARVSLALVGIGIITGCSENRGTAVRYDQDQYATASDTSGTYSEPEFTTARSQETTEPFSSTTTQPSQFRSGHEMTLDEFRNHMRNQAVVIVDARSPQSFRRGHARGALNVPAGDHNAFRRTFSKLP